MKEETDCIAKAIKAREGSINPVGQEELRIILEYVMLLGFKVGANQAHQALSQEHKKLLRELIRKTERESEEISYWYKL